MKKFLLVAVSVLLLCVCSAKTEATLIYRFDIFTMNGMYNENSELDIFVEVTDNTYGGVEFGFRNQSTIDSTVTKIYFDDDGLLWGAPTIINYEGVEFATGANPSNLPGGKELEVVFEATDVFSVSATAPLAHTGINSDEYLNLIFDLSEGKSFEDVTEALNNGALHIGLHITGLPDGSSESAVNVPEPASLLLIGLGGLVVIRRKDKKQL
ncbi:MAG: PEP-CTERM sorting domain-containing protein [Planctomycetes bacterium]|nr:PEP-CTERM sorting domain-containing protein [Planctomycetota bacterium]